MRMFFASLHGFLLSSSPVALIILAVRHREEARGMKALTALVCSYLEGDAEGMKRGDSTDSRNFLHKQSPVQAGIQGVARIMPILL